MYKTCFWFNREAHILNYRLNLVLNIIYILFHLPFVTYYYVLKKYGLRVVFTLLLLIFFTIPVFSQITVSGSVLDKGKINYVEAVMVVSTGGKIAITDSLGHYKIQVKKGDSLYFVYNNKPTLKFAVNTMPNTDQFDISIHVPVKSKYAMLKEVLVYNKSYKETRAENRETYAKVFNYKKPGISSSITPGGGVGLDAGELFDMFRFKRNKRMRKFQTWLEEEEKEKYINYRFSKMFVKRITQLKSVALDSFLVWYRPSFEFTNVSTDLEFNQYVLDASYNFRKMYAGMLGLPKVYGKKENAN
jgi:hypothetical protein